MLKNKQIDNTLLYLFSIKLLTNLNDDAFFEIA